jgi:hypothetical protein
MAIMVTLENNGRFSGFSETDELMGSQQKATSLDYTTANEVKSATLFDRYPGPNQRLGLFWSYNQSLIMW